VSGRLDLALPGRPSNSIKPLSVCLVDEVDSKDMHHYANSDIFGERPLRRNVYAISGNRLVCLESQANCEDELCYRHTETGQESVERLKEYQCPPACIGIL
jgi:hypothetical protein